MIEPLEPRTLLSAGGTLDPSFGSGGLLSGEAPVSVRIDGTMVADPDAGDLAVLNPDGSFDAAFMPPVSRGPTSGKSLRLSGGSISRVNADGTPDATFGNGGTVSDLTSGTTVTSFSPQALFTVGDQLLVAGSAQTSGSSSNFIAIERLNNDGSIDRTFGSQGIALSASGSSGSVNVAFIRTDVPTGNILIAGQLNGNPGVAKFGPAGQVLGQFFTATASDPHVYGLSVQNDEKTVLLIGADNKSFSLYRLNVDMSVDTSFGTNGSVAITAPDSPATVTRAFPGSLNIRPDGLIIVGSSFGEENGDSFGFSGEQNGDSFGFSRDLKK